MELNEQYKFVPLLAGATISAGIDLDSLNLKNYHSATIVLIFGSTLAGDPVITINSGATDGVKTTAEEFSYRYGSAATKSPGADTLTDRAVSSALTVVGATMASRMLICEISGDAMTEEQPFLTGSLSNAATAGTLTAFALLSPRYPSENMASALPDA